MTDQRRTYIALIGDIRGSRELEDRAQVQQDLEAILGVLNRRLGHSLAAELVITTGDEFQGLFLDGQAVVDAMASVSERFPGLSFAFGIGIGGLDTPLKDQAVGMDGPCFHAARKALEQRAKARDRWAAIAYPEELLGDETARGSPPSQDAVNVILSLMGAVRSGWTERQVEVISEVRRAPTQKAVAEGLGVSPSVVSESLSAARFRQVEEAEGTVGRMLGAVLEGSGR